MKPWVLAYTRYITKYILLFCKVCIQKMTSPPFLSTAIKRLSLYESPMLVNSVYLSLCWGTLEPGISQWTLTLDWSQWVRFVFLLGERSDESSPLCLWSRSPLSWILESLCRQVTGESAKSFLYLLSLAKSFITPSRNVVYWIPALICSSMKAVENSEHTARAILMWLFFTYVWKIWTNIAVKKDTNYYSILYKYICI